MIWKQSLKGQINYLDRKAAANLRYLRMPQRQSKFQPRRSAPQPVQPRRSGPQPVLAAELDPQPVLAAALEPQPVLAAPLEPQPVLAAALEPQSVLAAALEPQPFLAAALEPQPFLASLSHSTHGKSSARIYFQKLVIPGHLSVQCTVYIADNYLFLYVFSASYNWSGWVRRGLWMQESRYRENVCNEGNLQFFLYFQTSDNVLFNFYVLVSLNTT